MLRLCARRLYSNLKSFSQLQAMNDYLEANKFPMTIVYFRASWNPNCRQSDAHIDKFAASNYGVNVIKVDSDLAPKIKKHYGVRTQPEFVFCLYGDEVLRQIGPNEQGISEKVEKMQHLATNSNMSAVREKWQPYGTGFQVYYKRYLKAIYMEEFSDI